MKQISYNAHSTKAGGVPITASLPKKTLDNHAATCPELLPPDHLLVRLAPNESGGPSTEVVSGDQRNSTARGCISHMGLS